MNNKSVVNKNTDIDRIKVTLDKANNYLHGLYRLNSKVKEEKVLSIGYYYIYTNNKEKHYIRKCTFKVDTEKDYIEKIINEVDKSRKDYIKLNNKTYHYSHSTFIEHKSYRITGFRNIRILKINDYLTIEINDILQSQRNKKPYTILREVFDYLIKINVLKFKGKKLKNNIRQKSYRLLQKIKVSEIELSTDFVTEDGKKLYDSLNTTDKEILQYHNTKYWNNSYLNNKRTMFRFYNKARKENLDTLKYRFEVVIGRNILNSYNSKQLLKSKRQDLIETLSLHTKTCIRKLIDNIGYNTFKQVFETISKQRLTKRKVVKQVQNYFYLK